MKCQAYFLGQILKIFHNVNDNLHEILNLIFVEK